MLGFDGECALNGSKPLKTSAVTILLIVRHGMPIVLFVRIVADAFKFRLQRYGKYSIPTSHKTYRAYMIAAIAYKII